MSRKTKTLSAVMLLVGIVGVIMGCGGSQDKRQECSLVADSLQQDKEVISFVTDMYDNKRYEDYDFLRKHCSETLLKQLADEYDYDGDGFAVWSFRTGAQDQKDTTDVSKVISVNAAGNHWYEYSYLDMGWQGKQMLLVEKRGDTFVIMDKKVLYNECDAALK